MGRHPNSAGSLVYRAGIAISVSFVLPLAPLLFAVISLPPVWFTPPLVYVPPVPHSITTGTSPTYIAAPFDGLPYALVLSRLIVHLSVNDTDTKAPRTFQGMWTIINIIRKRVYLCPTVLLSKSADLYNLY
jgi:hypothetical protein